MHPNLLISMRRKEIISFDIVNAAEKQKREMLLVANGKIWKFVNN